MAKRNFGDRFDGELIRDINPFSYIMANILPDRTDNEAFVYQRIDLTNLDAYLEKKNAGNPDYKYNLFQCVVTAILKTVYLRPKMNRFIANNNVYQRNNVSASFVIKKQFDDHAEEALALLYGKPEDNIDAIHNEMYKQIHPIKTGTSQDASTDAMDMFTKIPRIISKTALKAMMVLDRHGMVPQSLIETDPHYASVVLSNLGSIGLQSGYHHLTNWGTNSCFVVIGKAKMTPVFDDEGNITMKHTVDLGLTVDERIGDGYYFAKTIRLLKTLLENPELLETRLDEKVDY